MELARLPPLSLVTYGFLLLAIIGLWVRPVVWVAALLGAVGCGYWSGVLTGPAVVWPALLAGACWLYRTGQGAPYNSRRRLQPPAAAVVLILAFLLGAHLLPVFNNPVLVRDLVLSPGASFYTRYLSFDKALVGLLLTGILGEELLRSRRDWLEALRRAMPWIVATIALVLGLTLALGQVALAPKWTSFFWLWAVTNLFFTCIAEEAFFRGFLQRESQPGARGVPWRAAAGHRRECGAVRAGPLGGRVVLRPSRRVGGARVRPGLPRLGAHRDGDPGALRPQHRTLLAVDLPQPGGLRRA
jgi:uncharacterized protein